jgi:hypothetical protein
MMLFTALSSREPSCRRVAEAVGRQMPLSMTVPLSFPQDAQTPNDGTAIVWPWGNSGKVVQSLFPRKRGKLRSVLPYARR